jgi:Putative prokaryotic signal transducing protein
MDSRDSLEPANEHGAPKLVTIRQFGDMSEALLAKGCLESAGIESFLADLNVSRMDWPVTRGTRLQVNADDVKVAMAFLEQSAADWSV